MELQRLVEIITEEVIAARDVDLAGSVPQGLPHVVALSPLVEQPLRVVLDDDPEPAAVGGGLEVAAVTVKFVDVNIDFTGLSNPTCAVVAPAGTVTLSKVSLTTCTPALCAWPIQAAVSPVYPDPMKVMTVPGGPEVGENEVYPGCG